MSLPRHPLPRHLLPLLLAGALLGCGVDNPAWALDHYVVTGELKPDGTCSASIDDQPLLPRAPALPSDSTKYRRGMAFNVGMRSGEDLHTVSCGGVILFFRWSQDSLLRAQAYPIKEERPEIPPRNFASGFAAAGQITAGIWPLALPAIGLYGREGTVELVAVDSHSVVGTFTFTGRRRSSM